MPWPGHDERLVGHEVGGREAELRPRLSPCDDLAAQLERARRGSGRPRSTSPAGTSPRMWRRGDDLAVDLDQRHDARLEAPVGAQQRRRRPCALWPKRKFSPTETCVAPSALDQHVVDELLRRCARERAVERDHDQLLDARAPAISSALRSSVVSSLGAASGRDHRERVRLEGQHGVRARDHLAVAEVDAVELAHGDAARAAARRRGAR